MLKLLVPLGELTSYLMPEQNLYDMFARVFLNIGYCLLINTFCRTMHNSHKDFGSKPAIGRDKFI